MLDETTIAGLVSVLALLVTLYFVGFTLTAPAPSAVGKVTKIVVYPLKSAKGIEVQSHRLDSRGLEFDRLWMVVDEDGTFLSQRRAPKLATVVVKLPKVSSDPLHLSAPGAAPIAVPVCTAPTAVQVRVWGDRCEAIDQGDEAAVWLSNVLGIEGARLVRMTESEKRVCSTKWGPKGATTAFSDGFPLLLANEASLGLLNDKLRARSKLPVPMERFRPNLVIGGPTDALTPFAEDGWSGMSVGDRRGHLGVSFGVVKPCARCKMVTIDQTSGVPDKRSTSAPTAGTPDDNDEGGGPAEHAEPTATLRTFRSSTHLGYKKPFDSCDVFFGQNIVHESTYIGKEIAVGDAVVATPRRGRGVFSRGVLGIDY